MGRVAEKYDRRKAEKRFAPVYTTVDGDHCIYCGMPNDGKFDHQPPVYILHRFANGGLVTKRAIREQFGECLLVPCCTICNMGLGAYHGVDNNDRREEIVDWFIADEMFREDFLVLEIGRQLVDGEIELHEAQLAKPRRAAKAAPAQTDAALSTEPAQRLKRRVTRAVPKQPASA